MIIAKEVIGCSNDDLYCGYSRGGLNDRYSPVIAVIDLEIDSKIYHGRAVRSLQSEYMGSKNPGWNAIIQGVIDAASANVVAAIKSDTHIEIKKQ